MPKKKSKKTSKIRPPKTSIAPAKMKEMLEGLGEGATFNLWFKPIGIWDISEHGDVTFPLKGGDAYRAEKWQMGPIAHRDPIEFTVQFYGELPTTAADVSKDGYFEAHASVSGGPAFNLRIIDLEAVAAIHVTDEGAPRATVHSFKNLEDLTLPADEDAKTLHYGGLEIPREEAEELFKALGPWLGYDVAS